MIFKFNQNNFLKKKGTNRKVNFWLENSNEELILQNDEVVFKSDIIPFFLRLNKITLTKNDDVLVARIEFHQVSIAIILLSYISILIISVVQMNSSEDVMFVIGSFLFLTILFFPIIYYFTKNNIKSALLRDHNKI